MRWLVGWSSAAARAAGLGSAGSLGHDGETLHPVGSQLLWGDPDPLWAVGDWRPDEVRVVKADEQNRIAVLGICGASDEDLRRGLFTARGGALRHLTNWPGSYTAVVQVGRRVTVCGDLAGARPVFHTPWAGGTAFATAALPLADLIEANLDFGHLAALLAAPDVPAALRDTTPYEGVRRIPPGHALVLRAGAREIAGYDPVSSLAVSAVPADPDRAVDAVRDALVEAVRTRLAAPRHVPDLDPGPVPGMGPAERRARRGMPVPGIGADLS
ncbi:asparagine synthase, partial [Streptomyces sp. SID69]|nr:asparagine synthase [Streptomyces sp. SID69]